MSVSINNHGTNKPSSKMWTGMHDINAQYNFKNAYEGSDFEPFDEDEDIELASTNNANPVAYMKPSDAKSGGGSGVGSGIPGASSAWASGPVLPWKMKIELMDNEWDEMGEGEHGAQHIDSDLRLKYVGEAKVGKTKVKVYPKINSVIPSDPTTAAQWKAERSGWSKELEDIIVRSGSSWAIYQFALKIPGANIRRLERAMIKTKDPMLIYQFARFIRRADIQKLEQAIIDLKDPAAAYFFAHDVEGANIPDLIDFVLINEPWRIEELFRNFPRLKRKYELGEIRKQIRGILK